MILWLSLFAGMLPVVKFLSGGQSAPPPAPSSASAARANWPDEPASRLIFFAVLEGLYTDGVSNDVVDLVLPPDAGGRERNLREHFVYACPLCHPAMEAFRLYRDRRAFFGLKPGTRDTFGPGLPDSLLAGLRSRNKIERLAAVQSLIDRWVRRRLAMMRLSPAEQTDWTTRIESGRKQGMAALQSDERRYGDKKCAVCEGAAAACATRP